MKKDIIKLSVLSLLALLLLAVVFADCGGGGGGGGGGATPPPGGGGGGGGSLAVTYDANGATGGSVPVDSNSYVSGQTVTVPGNTGSLTYTAGTVTYTFVGWQTKADGSGKAYTPGKTCPMGSANLTLYALWAGGYAYTVNWSDSTVSQYTIGPNGALTPMFTPSVSTGGSDPRWLTVDPSGKYLYVSNYHGMSPIGDYGFVSQFRIGADGSLTSMSTPTFFTAGPTIAGGAVHPTKPWYYVAQGWSSVSQNIINADGSLTSMSSPTVAAGTSPIAVAIDPSGNYVYVPNGPGNTVSQYTIGPNGALTPMSTPTVATGGYNADEIKIVSISSGTYAYVANYGDGVHPTTVSQYSINSSGMLSPLTPATVSLGASYALSIAVDPRGRFAYVPIFTAPSGVIAQFKINPDGTLVSNGTVSTVQSLAAFVAIESSGNYAYVTSGNNNNGIGTTISQYTIDQTTGKLTLMSNPSVSTGYAPCEIVTVGK